EPRQSVRDFGVKLKLNPVRSILEGKRVVLIDDSIVRGTTSRKIVRMIRSAGAKEVHMRISCPPTISPCFYGIDTPTKKELIASSHTVEEIAKYIEADSLGYLSLPGLMRAVGGKSNEFCTACYTGQSPIDFVNHCIDDILVQGAKPLFFMDYIATGRLNADVMVSVVEGVARACKEAGCALIGGETAEMPGFYADGEYDVAGFIVGIVDRSQILDGKSIRPGDILIGLPSVGLHTNGYSLALKLFF